MAKTRKVDVPLIDPEEVEAAKHALSRTKTKADVAAVWEAYYLKIGHKRLGRMLIGRDPETRRRDNG